MGLEFTLHCTWRLTSPTYSLGRLVPGMLMSSWTTPSPLVAVGPCGVVHFYRSRCVKFLVHQFAWHASSLRRET